MVGDGLVRWTVWEKVDWVGWVEGSWEFEVCTGTHRSSCPTVLSLAFFSAPASAAAVR